jgi:hypothetical protein
LQIVAGCFEKKKEVSMKSFVEAFGNLLTREQIKSLIYKLEDEKLLIKIKANKYTHYILNKENIDIQYNIYGQFIEKLSEH